MTLSCSPRFLTMFAASICLMAVGLVGAQASVAKTTSCKVPAYPGGDGNGYFTGRIKATNVTCVSARKLVRVLLLLPHQGRRQEGHMHAQGRQRPQVHGGPAGLGNDPDPVQRPGDMQEGLEEGRPQLPAEHGE